METTKVGNSRPEFCCFSSNGMAVCGVSRIGPLDPGALKMVDVDVVNPIKLLFIPLGQSAKSGRITVRTV